MDKLADVITKSYVVVRIRGLFSSAPSRPPKTRVSNKTIRQSKCEKRWTNLKKLLVKKNVISKIEFSSVLILSAILLIVFIAITPPIRAGILSILSLTGPGNSGVSEIPEKRTEYAKVFKNKNGAYTTLIFATPIHYLDQEGEWQDIDVNIINKQAAGVSFLAKFGETPSLEFTAAETQIKLEPQNVNAVSGKVEGSQITYVGAYDSTDIRYSVGATQVEEKIILKSRAAPSSFSFKITSNIQIPPLYDGELNFSTFRTLKPFARDAKGNIYPVSVELVSLKDGDYLILKANEDWLKEAKYPIVIDPTIAIKPELDSGKDAYVDNSQPNVNFGTLVDLGVYDNVATKTRSYLQFELSSIPKGSIISNASLQLYTQDVLGGSVFLRKVTSSWDEASINWNNQPLFEEVVDTRVVDATATWFAWDITNLVNDWCSKKIPNYGVVLLTDEANVSNGGLFCSSDFSADVNLRPKLVVDYIPDNMPPGSIIKQPKDNIFLKGSTYTISGLATDNRDGSGLAKVQISTDGGDSWFNVTGTDSWTYTWALPSDGAYNIKSRAIDAAGNVETPSVGITVTVDNTTPKAMIASPRGGTISGALVVSGVASDENFKFYKLQYGAGTSPTEWKNFGAVSFEPVLSGRLKSGFTAGLNNGIYTIQLVVEDKAGNITTDSAVMVVDN
jgi:hypothetical protein